VNEITSQSGGKNRTLTYDLNGSITSDGGTRTFEWDGANRLVAINYTGATTRSEFTYDGLSRVAKIVEKTGNTINSTRKFVWCGEEKCEFRDGNDAVTHQLYGNGQYSGGLQYYYLRDHLGSIREMVKSGGTSVASRYDYDPYGRSTTILNTTPSDFTFTGLYRHSKSNLDLATHRAYDPDLGRWLSRDPIGESGGLNLYGYVANHPALGVDPSGLYTEILTFGPAGHRKSSFGHTAVNINGTVYSFTEKGWYTDSFERYMTLNGFRSAVGLVLSLSDETEVVLESRIRQDIDQHPQWSPSSNCDVRLRTQLNEALDGALDYEPPTQLPLDFMRLLFKFQGLVDEVHYYPRTR
jgi:RHS repeat-associated protein